MPNLNVPKHVKCIKASPKPKSDQRDLQSKCVTSKRYLGQGGQNKCSGESLHTIGFYLAMVPTLVRHSWEQSTMGCVSPWAKQEDIATVFTLLAGYCRKQGGGLDCLLV